MAVALLVIGVVSAGLTFFTPTATPQAHHERTEDVLATVKQALIGYAAQRGEVQTCGNLTFLANIAACAAALVARPGELPCPDTDNDGIAENQCGDVQKRLGRVPWKTLGIPDPKDGAGETLWYAVALPFMGTASNPIVVNGSGTVTSGMINSSTVGNLEVRAEARDAAGAPYSVTTTVQAAAVLFSPGIARNGQNRSSTVAACPGRPNVARNLCPANYLETAAGTNNSVSGGPFIAGTSTAAYNDRLIHITAVDIMPVVEMRVGRELKNLLEAYRKNSACRCYPWADSWSYSGGVADVGVNRGRFPSTAYPVNWGFKDTDNDIPPLPSWIPMNDWHNLAVYAAARQETQEAGRYCHFCSNNKTLAVYNEPGGAAQAASAIVFTPGTPRGLPRPPSPSSLKAQPSVANAMNAYLEEALNNNKGSCAGWDAEHAGDTTPSNPQTATAACDTYVVPQSRAHDRDRLHMIRTEPGSHCATAARALLKLTPCLLNAGLCATLQASLQTCSCAGAALSLDVVGLNLCIQ